MRQSSSNEMVNILAQTKFIIKDIDIFGDFVLFLELGSLDVFKDMLNNYIESN